MWLPWLQTKERPPYLYILQRGVQWKQGVVIWMVLYTILLYNTTPIHCTPLWWIPNIIGQFSKSFKGLVLVVLPLPIDDSHYMYITIYIYIYTYIYIYIYSHIIWLPKGGSGNNFMFKGLISDLTCGLLHSQASLTGVCEKKTTTTTTTTTTITIAITMFVYY